MATCPSCGKDLPGEFPFCPFCGAPLAESAPAREQRKRVTVLFCDVTGSTALGESTDPEAVRALLARYFEQMKRIVESHGGTVEKFVGDAVMAVFGVPQVHEDDALRAVRAAVDMRDALPELGVQARIGVNTGEVVTGTAERLATGDAVNVASRLEQAAQAGEILVGEETLRLVRDAVEAVPVEPLALKGKVEPVPAFRLLSAAGELTRRHGAPLVGRQRERRLLADSWERVRSESSCFLFTLLGAAGVGKSRLAAEFLEGVEGEARVVRARCLSYGEGITYWPVVEVLVQLGVRPEEESAAAAIASLTGEREAATTPDEIAWAVRKTLERAAAVDPLVVVFDDIHWGEPAFLELVEHVADFSRDAPILLLCIARPELLERREGWGGGKVNAATVLLEPLSAQETDELLDSLGQVDEGLRERIREAAEGNPLFVEEMLAMVREADNGDVAVPPTIQALLAARIDQLDAAERAVLERGAVEGKVFHRGAVQALAPEEREMSKRLMSLVRKELVRPDKAQLRGDDAFRFRHLLIRDAAYDALPKAERADLHERFALWLEEHGAGLVELDEILGYHLEQAWTYRRELGQALDGRLAAKARERLTAAGRRAFMRQDFPAANNLLERALGLVPAGQIDVALEIDRVDAVFFSRGPGDALPLAADLVERTAGAGDPVVELSARLEEATLGIFGDKPTSERLMALVEEALPVLEAAGDDFGLYMAHNSRSVVLHHRGILDDKIASDEHALECARQLQLPHLEAWVLGHTTAARYFGSTPVSEVLRWIDEMEAAGFRHPLFQRIRGEALGMLGRIEEARALLEEERDRAAERGSTMNLAQTLGHSISDLELRAADPGAAAAAGEEGCRLFEEAGETGWFSTAAGKLAEAYYRLDRLDQAEAWAARAEELGAREDAITQMLWRQVRAKVAARRGEHSEALRLAREAVEIAENVQLLDSHADAYSDLAEVLELAGEDPRPALEEALARYERKGNVVMAERTRGRLEQHTPASS